MKKFKRLLSLAVMTALLISSVAFNVSAQVDEKVLFTDDFENGAGNWNVQSGSVGEIGDEIDFQATYTTAQSGLDEVYLEGMNQKDVEMDMKFSASQWSDDESAYVAAHIRYKDKENNYRLAYYPATATLKLDRISGGVLTNIDSKIIETPLSVNEEYTFTLAVRDTSVRAEINGDVYIAKIDVNTPVVKGSVAFSANNQSVTVSDITVNKETKLVYHNFNAGYTFGIHENGILVETDDKDSSVKVLTLPSGSSYYLGDGSTTETTNSKSFNIRTAPWENTKLTVVTRRANDKLGDFVIGTKWNKRGYEDGYKIWTGAGGSTVYYARNCNYNNSLVTVSGLTHTWASGGWKGDYHTFSLTSVNDGEGNVKNSFYRDNETIVENLVDTYRKSGWHLEIPTSGGFNLTTAGTAAKVYVKEIILESVNEEPETYYNGFGENDIWNQVGSATTSFDVVGGGVVNQVYKTTAETNLPLVLNNKEWNNIAVSADLKSDNWNNSEASFAGVAARYVDDKNYILYKYSDYNAENSAKGTVSIAEIVNGKENVVTSAAVDKFAADKHTVKLEVKNGMYRGYVDGKIVLAIERPYTYTIGSIALVSNNQAAKFDNVVVNGERDYYYQNFELPFDGMNINTDLKLYTANNNAVYGTDPATGNGVLVGGSAETTGNFYQSFNTNYTSLSENPWSHIGFNVRLKPTTWNGMEVIPRIQNRHSSGIYKLMFEKSGDEYKVYFHRNIDDLVVATGLLTAADVTYLTPKADRVTTNLLTDGEYALICAEAQDNTDGSVTLRAYINGTLITEVTDYGPSQAVKDKLASDKPNWGGNGPITATLSNGTATVSVASSKKGVWYLDEVWIEDMSAVENLTPELSFDKEELTANETVTCTMTAVNNTFETASAELIVALYSEDGKVLDFVSPSKTLTLKPGETGSETIPVTLPADVTGLKLRAFAWSDLETLTPLADVVALPEN